MEKYYFDTSDRSEIWKQIKDVFELGSSMIDDKDTKYIFLHQTDLYEPEGKKLDGIFLYEESYCKCLLPNTHIIIYSGEPELQEKKKEACEFIKEVETTAFFDVVIDRKISSELLQQYVSINFDNNRLRELETCKLYIRSFEILLQIYITANQSETSPIQFDTDVPLPNPDEFDKNYWDPVVKIKQNKAVMKALRQSINKDSPLIERCYKSFGESKCENDFFISDLFKKYEKYWLDMLKKRAW